jgi:DNA-binding transcriptional regulator YdaS (Cro superfamily)
VVGRGKKKLAEQKKLCLSFGMRPPPINLAIEKAGGRIALASAIGITPQSISMWRAIPVKRIAAISRVTGLTVEQLRPDLFASQKEAA